MVSGMDTYTETVPSQTPPKATSGRAFFITQGACWFVLIGSERNQKQLIDATSQG
jgi:hypothetical protein